MGQRTTVFSPTANAESGILSQEPARSCKSISGLLSGVSYDFYLASSGCEVIK